MILKKISSLADGSIETNLTFNETGNKTIYIEVPGDVNVIDATVDVTPTTNASLDVGNDGSIEWTANETNKTQITPDLSPVINDYINNNNLSQNQTFAVTGTIIYSKSGNVLVPFVFYSDSAGIVKISNIAITYVNKPVSLDGEKSSFFERIWNFIKNVFVR